MDGERAKIAGLASGSTAGSSSGHQPKLEELAAQYTIASEELAKARQKCSALLADRTMRDGEITALRADVAEARAEVKKLMNRPRSSSAAPVPVVSHDEGAQTDVSCDGKSAVAAAGFMVSLAQYAGSSSNMAAICYAALTALPERVEALASGPSGMAEFVKANKDTKLMLAGHDGNGGDDCPYKEENEDLKVRLENMKKAHEDLERKFSRAVGLSEELKDENREQSEEIESLKKEVASWEKWNEDMLEADDEDEEEESAPAAAVRRTTFSAAVGVGTTGATGAQEVIPPPPPPATGERVVRSQTVEAGSGASGSAGARVEVSTKSDGTVVHTEKICEHTKIVSPPWQGVGKSKDFICELIRNCITAGGRTDDLAPRDPP